tara:strand:+ start:990 stop:1280 length:291 start_codon:yes stop_codon:yes gene_type:complete
LSDSEILFKAAINRITARITEKLINSAEEFPQRLQDEWTTLKEEIIEESQRIEKQSNSSKQKNYNKKPTEDSLTQVQIDKIRSKVIEINKLIEEKN